MKKVKEIVEKAVKPGTLGAAWAAFNNVSTEETVDLAGEKVIREWQGYIRTAKGNIDKAVLKYNEAQIEIDQELVERKQAYMDSFLQIDKKDVATVELRKKFVDKYERNIAIHQAAVEEYETAMENREKAHNKYVEGQLDIVAQYENRIATLEKLINK